MEELLAQTINVALNLKLISAKHLETVIIDTTVQPKAIAHPTDSKLLEVARNKLVEIAKENSIPLKQTFAKEGKALRFQAGRYAHARQFRRMSKAVKRQSTIVRKLHSAIESKMTTLSEAVKGALAAPLARAQQLILQARKAEFFHLNKFADIENLRTRLRRYIRYYNNERIRVKLNGLSPVHYRPQASCR